MFNIIGNKDDMMRFKFFDLNNLIGPSFKKINLFCNK